MGHLYHGELLVTVSHNQRVFFWKGFNHPSYRRISSNHPQYFLANFFIQWPLLTYNGRNRGTLVMCQFQQNGHTTTTFCLINFWLLLSPQTCPIDVLQYSSNFPHPIACVLHTLILPSGDQTWLAGKSLLQKGGLVRGENHRTIAGWFSSLSDSGSCCAWSWTFCQHGPPRNGNWTMIGKWLLYYPCLDLVIWCHSGAHSVYIILMSWNLWLLATGMRIEHDWTNNKKLAEFT